MRGVFIALISSPFFIGTAAAQSPALQVRMEVQSLGDELYEGRVYYNTSDNSLTTGLGLRLHYDSSVVTSVSVEDILTSSIVGEEMQLDVDNYDNNESTDQLYSSAWADISGNWPPESLDEVQLYSFTFELTNPEIQQQTAFSFTSSSIPSGYQFSPEAFSKLLPVENKAPNGTDKTVKVEGEGTYTFDVSDFGFNDPQDVPPHKFDAVKITTLPSEGVLTIDQSQIVDGQFIEAEQIPELTYTVSMTTDSKDDSFTFQVRDSGGTAFGGLDTDPQPNTISIQLGVERRALIAFYNATAGDSWTNRSGWLDSETHQCDWYGITCDEDEHVTQIDLTGNNLSGSLSRDMTRLSQLWDLRLANNHLQGEIPDWINEFNSLSQIVLNNNEISGEIPDALGNAAELSHIFLADNQLSGNLPSSLQNLGDNVRTIVLRGNNLSGTLPAWISNFTKIGRLELSNNNFEGVIPRSIANLEHLFRLILSNNNLSGFVPAELLARDDITFAFDGNRFGTERQALIALYDMTNGDAWVNKDGWLGPEGTECEWYGVTCEDGVITAVTLARNGLVGTLPEQLGELWQLEELNLQDNYLSGVVPDVFSPSIVLNFKYNPLDTENAVQIVSTPDVSRIYLNRQNVIPVHYDTSDNNEGLTGLGLRIHYNSSQISNVSFSSILSTSLIGAEVSSAEDVDNYDNDPSTNRYMTIAWADINGDWPGTLPIHLFDLTFDAANSLSEDEMVRIGFSKNSNPSGYGLRLPLVWLEPIHGTLDVDGDGSIQALTDALLVVRKLFGFTGSNLISKAIGENALYTTPEEINDQLNSMSSILDIDDNGNIDALTDGLLIMRYAFGFRGQTLVTGAIGNNANRANSAQIEAYIDSFFQT